MQQFRSNVKSTISSICTIGYAGKSNTKDPMAAKIKPVNIQIYKLKKKLLCKEVFESINTSANDSILSRDHDKFHRLSQYFVGCSNDLQSMINFITETNRKVRLLSSILLVFLPTWIFCNNSSEATSPLSKSRWMKAVEKCRT